MRIADGVEMLEISATILGRVNTIHPALSWDAAAAVLVDTGYPGQMQLIVDAMEKAGVPLSRLNRILMSHQDLDHIGSLPVLVQEAAQPVEVLAHKAERPFIQGEMRQLKITPQSIDKAVQALPPGVPETMRNAFRANLENPPKARVDRTIEDGEELPYCGGITVIGTFGHTPGHLSFYHKPSKSLIAADALIVNEGQLYGPNPQHSIDIDLAVSSLRKLLDYDIESVICYHGGLYKGNVRQRIAEIINSK
jgi:glyoxylase-like metal-dependent hydrolase (beta-lactamase superfamily II)